MAIGEMAYMKDNGYGMPMNKEEAEKIYLQLAEERDDEWSMIKLAYIEMDRGNSEERLKWIQKALEKEYIDAYVDLGIFYQSDEKYKRPRKSAAILLSSGTIRQSRRNERIGDDLLRYAGQ